MKRLVLFAHWDPEAQVRAHLLRHLEALAATGAVVHFTSTAPLAPAEQGKLEPWCRRVTLLPNQGFDFTQWRTALAEVDPGAWDRVVLANSSVLGPLFPLGPILDRMDARDLDFWGMTESGEGVPHLQSYFLSLRAGLLAEAPFRRFWDGVLPYRDKQSVIAAYELGFTAWLRDCGCRGAAAFPLPDRRLGHLANWRMGRGYRSRIRLDRDPTLTYPDLLLAEGMPYVKLSLLRDNPNNLDLDALRALLEQGGWNPDTVG